MHELFLQDAPYQYDAYGRRHQMTYLSGFFISYAYDNADQITLRMNSNTAFQLPTAAGASTGYTIDGQNRIAQVGTANMAFDGRGNLLSDDYTGRTTLSP